MTDATGAASFAGESFHSSQWRIDTLWPGCTRDCWLRTRRSDASV